MPGPAQLLRCLIWIFFFCASFCTASATALSTSHFVASASGTLPAACGLSLSTGWHLHLFSFDVLRWGEALHPGPADHEFLIGFSNPSGLRNKEAVALAHGVGILSLSETHLSKVTQRSSALRFRQLATELNRNVRLHFGAAVAPRVNSDWAGSWSGVATLSDFPSQEVRLPYGHERECGRALVTRHYVDGISVLNAVVYGFPCSPTWPKAKQLTTELLGILTTEIVLGAQGPRVIGGDFNLDSTAIPLFQYWRSLGWQSAQDLAYDRWGQEKSFTCKGATETDLLWLSPEAIAHCRWVDVSDHFAEHATVSAGLAFPKLSPCSLVWPRPSKIDYCQVSPTWQTTALPPVWDTSGTVDEQWAQWASSFETSLNGHMRHQPDARLQRNQLGRLQRTKPVWRQPPVHHVKPSRPSEVVIRNDLIGHETIAWFRQLRRLQSYVMAIANNKQTPVAIAYRLELWSSILRSPGFAGGFSRWWTQHRPCDLPDAPFHIPICPPNHVTALAIFSSFKSCYEKFESWHLRQRARLLRSKYETGMSGIFADLRKQPRDRLDFLQQTKTYGVLATEAQQIHLDSPISVNGCSVWKHQDQGFDPTIINEVVISANIACEVGDEIQQQHTISDIPTIHAELLKYWQRTWCAMESVDASTWQRVTGFFQAYMPQLEFALAPISVTEWRKTLKRFKPTAARGVDGFSHEDLLAMPTPWTQRLLDLLNQIELGHTPWPTPILFGIVSVIAKDIGATTIDRYRPIVIFSVIYRAWSSLRSRQLLRILAPRMNCEAYGFLPGCEPSQHWAVLQGEIEYALSTEQALCGLSTDLIRAFNNIPRQHTFALAEHLGVPSRVTAPWRCFLDSCTRSFEIRGALSSSTQSNCGLPEGDALSVYAMVQLDFAWHVYMRAFSPSVRAISFVDNLALVTTIPEQLATALVCLVEFFRLWNLEIEAAKSYCWSTLTAHRKMLQAMPFKCVDSARELGGILSFTRKAYTGLQKLRHEALEPRWFALQKSWAPMRQKLMAIPAVFWAAALHGIYGSCIGEKCIETLRGKAVSSLRLRKAGANPLLRLGLSSTPSADPGLWRAQQTLHTFRRLARKEPRFFALWQAFMSSYNGCLFSGPFSQLLTVLGQ